MKKSLLYFFSLLMSAVSFTACDKPASLESISFNKSSLALQVGESYTLVVLYEPESAAKIAPDIIWESTQENVATVKGGIVHAEQVGKTTIIAHCGKLEAQCEVEVTEDPAEQKILPGKFSVASGKKVRFAQGNLQYKPSINTWRFAENQWDIIGDENTNIGQKEACSYWLDLFGFGTGKEPFKMSKSETFNFNDWGENPISNGGNQPYLWRTLTKDEFGYLLNGREKAIELACLGAIEYADGYYRNGLFLLPDDWTAPDGISLKLGVSYESAIYGAYTDNQVTMSQWNRMEQAGAVFLPAAGSRTDCNVKHVNQYGEYWTSTETASDDLYGYILVIQSDVCSVAYADRNIGLAVRLVQRAE